MRIPFDNIIVEPKRNCRGEINPIDLTELRESLKENGLIHPLVVRTTDRGLELVAGYSRYKAIKQLRREDPERWDKVEVHIRDCDDVHAGILNLEENLKRRNINIKDEANAIKRLLSYQPDLTTKEIATRLGYSVNWVKVRLALLDLEPEIQDAAVNGLIETRTIMQFKPLDHDKRIEWLKSLKEAKIRGVKTAPKPVDLTYTKVVETKKLARSRYDIFAMQSHIRKWLGNGMETRLLAWAAAEIDSKEIFQDLQDILGDEYIMPEGELEE